MSTANCCLGKRLLTQELELELFICTYTVHVSHDGEETQEM